MRPRLAGAWISLTTLVLLGGPAPVDEIARIRQHLRGAEAILETRDVSSLSGDQRANRRLVMTMLAEYRAAGAFPRNDRFPDRRVPFFRDRDGTLCAMAWLLDRTGHGHIVEHVARTRNNAWVPELADEPGLVEWLDRYGISLAEAARIQPAYGPPGEVPNPGRISAGFAVASVVGMGLAGTGATLNLTAPRGERRLAWLAAGAGFVTTMLGAAKLDNGGDVRKLAVADVVIGGVATLIGLNGLFAAPEPARRSDERGPPRLDVAMTVSPAGAPGLAARLRF